MPPTRGDVAPAPSAVCMAARYHQLTDLSLPLYSKDDNVDRVFYPLDGLRETYTERKVLEILQCTCAKCTQDKDYFERRMVLETCAQKIVKSDDGIRTFALLLSIGHPLLVLGFVQRAHGDIVPPKSVSDTNLSQRYWPSYQQRAPLDFDFHLKQFQSRKFQFEAPILDDGYAELERQEILPFANEKRIGGGSYGTVYRLEVPAYHCQAFPEHSRPVWNQTIVRSGSRKHVCIKYALKKFNERNDEDFWAETKNLRRVHDMIEGEHVVSMLKAYKRDGDFNILFPYADMNLEEFLKTRGPENRGAPLEHDIMWPQVLGISKALSKIAESVDQTADGPAVRRTWFGCHFDLKPANILIFGNGVWKIADFGQAAFKPRQGTDSKMTNEGGSDAYSAPETERHEVSGPRYDVWSLGCIVLEVITFLVAGRGGLFGANGLIEVRKSMPPGTTGLNSRLWQHDTGDTFVVKPEIEKFMHELGNKLPSDTPSSRFLHLVLKLVKKMLHPVIEARSDANGVVQEMGHIIASSKKQTTAISTKSTMYEGDRRMGQHLLSNLEFWHFRRPTTQNGILPNTQIAGASSTSQQRHDHRVKVELYLYLTDQGEVRSDCISDLESYVYPTTIIRSNAMFVPVYAFSSKVREYRFLPHFYISAQRDPKGRSETENRPTLIMQGLKFSVTTGISNQPSNAIAAQSAYTGQRVLGSRSFRLKRYKTHKVVHPLNRIQGKLEAKWKEVIQRRRADQPAQTPDEAEGIWMQIWREEPPDDANSGRQQLTRIRRVVVFNRDRSIFVLRMQVQWTMRENHDEDNECDLVVFEPTSPDKNDVFMGSVLHRQRTPSSDEENIAFAGIPLDPTELRKSEQRDEQEYDQVDLVFENSEDARLFARLFRKEKWASHKERHPPGT